MTSWESNLEALRHSFYCSDLHPACHPQKGAERMCGCHGFCHSPLCLQLSGEPRLGSPSRESLRLSAQAGPGSGRGGQVRDLGPGSGFDKPLGGSSKHDWNMGGHQQLAGGDTALQPTAMQDRMSDGGVATSPFTEGPCPLLLPVDLTAVAAPPRSSSPQSTEALPLTCSRLSDKW